MNLVNHVPVMLLESLECLNIRPDGCYVDCTFGRGGHTTEILKRLNTEGRVVAIDRDPDAIDFGRETFTDSRLCLQHARFSELEAIAKDRGIHGSIDGVLVDLGVSSPQLDSPTRGFSFQSDGPLDMRMDPSQGLSAAQWLSQASEPDIVSCLRDFGEERHAKKIARYIVEDRETQAIETTSQLAALVKRAVPKANRQRIHPATRTFQALRILVNEELQEVSALLAQALRVINLGARVVVIAFHSLEDRIVKRFFRDTCANQHDASANQFKLPFRKPLRPAEEEQSQNSRARSARLRVIERTA
ncbi:MAG: 16S rRNA (cytosine(1402)-N(4))-methyltransferase RsmH [Pseudomonadota bacterium]